MKILILILTLLFSNYIHAFNDESVELGYPDDLMLEGSQPEIQTLDISLYKSLDDEIIRLVKEELSQKEANVDLRYESDFRAKYIQENIETLRDISLLKLNPKNHTFKVKVTLNKKDQGKSSYEINGRYASFLEIPISKRVIRHGDIVKSEDITKIRTKTSNISSNIILSEEQLVGMEAKNVISSGRYFKRSDIRKSPVIFAKNIVTMKYISGHLSVKTTGIALEEGSVGDTIKVKNEKSGNEIYAKIIEKDVVAVTSN